MTDLTPYLNQTEILEATARQVEKDFGMSGMEIGYSGSGFRVYDELFTRILPFIEKLLTQNANGFYALMYRIDISEVQIRNALSKDRTRPAAEVLADLILKRELLKVVMRRKFST